MDSRKKLADSIHLRFFLLGDLHRLIGRHLQEVDAKLEKEVEKAFEEYDEQSHLDFMLTVFSDRRSYLKEHMQTTLRALALMTWSQVEAFLKSVIALGRRIEGRSYEEWSLRETRVYYQAVRTPLQELPQYGKVMMLNSICNCIKHRGGRATQNVAKQGYAPGKGKQILLNEKQIEEFRSASEAFLQALARSAAIESGTV